LEKLIFVVPNQPPISSASTRLGILIKRVSPCSRAVEEREIWNCVSSIIFSANSGWKKLFILVSFAITSFICLFFIKTSRICPFIVSSEKSWSKMKFPKL